MKPMASSVNAGKFVVSYKVEGTNPDSYTIENGVLKLKDYSASSNSKVVTPKATVTITGTDFKKVTTFTDVTAKRQLQIRKFLQLFRLFNLMEQQNT